MDHLPFSFFLFKESGSRPFYLLLIKQLKQLLFGFEIRTACCGLFLTVLSFLVVPSLLLTLLAASAHCSKVFREQLVMTPGCRAVRVVFWFRVQHHIGMLYIFPLFTTLYLYVLKLICNFMLIHLGQWDLHHCYSIFYLENFNTICTLGSGRALPLLCQVLINYH